MFSDLIELMGLALIACGVFVLLGLGWALLAGGGCLLIVGAGVNDAAVLAALGRARTSTRRAAGAPMRRVRARKTRTA